MEAEMKRRSTPKRNEAMTAPVRDPIEVKSPSVRKISGLKENIQCDRSCQEP